MLLAFCYWNQAYSQGEYRTTNYYGVEFFTLYSYNSDDAESLRDLFIEETDLKKQISFKTGLKELYELTKDNRYKEISIQIGYEIYKNPYAEEQYYGNYVIRVLRVLMIPNTDFISSPTAEIFSVSTTFVTNYPIRNAWKKEIKEHFANLIDKFALDFRSSY